ncbi:unnamed protein product, partial [Allacma fusca]
MELLPFGSYFKHLKCL